MSTSSTHADERVDGVGADAIRDTGVSQTAYDAMPSWKRAELLQKILRPSTMIGRRVNLPMRAGGGIGVIRDVQANLCFVDREISDEDEGWEGLDMKVTCNRDELSYVDEDAAE